MDRLSRLSNSALTRHIGLRPTTKHVSIVKAMRKEILVALSTRLDLLSFLDGKKGKIKATYMEFEDLFFSDYGRDAELEEAFWNVQREYLEELKIGFSSINTISGMFVYDKNNKPVQVRLGKYFHNLLEWAKKKGFRRQAIRSISTAAHNWEIRELDWDWTISTSHKEIYSASTDRPWTSCLEFRLDSVEPINEYVQAGTAVILFSRRGHVCGRRLLEPCATRKGRPGILVGDLYGSGPGAQLVAKALRQTISSLRGRYSDTWIYNGLVLDPAYMSPDARVQLAFNPRKPVLFITDFSSWGRIGINGYD